VTRCQMCLKASEKDPCPDCATLLRDSVLLICRHCGNRVLVKADHYLASCDDQTRAKATRHIESGGAYISVEQCPVCHGQPFTPAPRLTIKPH